LGDETSVGWLYSFKSGFSVLEFGFQLDAVCIKTHFTLGNSIQTCAKYRLTPDFLVRYYCAILGVSSDRRGVLKIIVFCNVTVGIWIDKL